VRAGAHRATLGLDAAGLSCRRPEPHPSGHLHRRASDAQRRQVVVHGQAEAPGAAHIEEGYEQRGVPAEEAERRACATVNKVGGQERVVGA
jgi:hypothetical protein